MVQSSNGNNIANTSGSVTFKCPKCQENIIVSSRNERETVAKYLCAKCGFNGPN